MAFVLRARTRSLTSLRAGALARSAVAASRDLTIDADGWRRTRAEQTSWLRNMMLAGTLGGMIQGHSSSSDCDTAPMQVKKDVRTFALVGGGPASLSAAEALREHGFTGRVIMFAAEPTLPYDRTLASKHLDRENQEPCLLKPESWYAENNIEVHLSTRVTKLDTACKKLAYQRSEDGVRGSLEYDRVLVASGGSPRKLFIPGSDMHGIYTLRTSQDAKKIIAEAKPRSRVVVIGGSFIAMEMASSLKERGMDVVIVAMETLPFERVLGKKVGAAFAKMLDRKQIEWMGTSEVRVFRGNDKVNGVELGDGEILPADFVVVGAGTQLNTRFVDGVSLNVEGAIPVSPLLCSTSEPTLFAAGDICAFPTVMTGALTRIEHWNVASGMGRVAAINMLDQFVPYTDIPTFWSNIFGNSIQYVGFAPQALDRVIIQGDVHRMDFVAFYTEDDKILAVATVNRDAVFQACKALFEARKMPRASEILLGNITAEQLLQMSQDL